MKKNFFGKRNPEYVKTEVTRKVVRQSIILYIRVVASPGL